MKVYNLFKKIYALAPIEILDKNNVRLYYGYLANIDKTTYKLIKREEVESICGQVVDISENEKDYIIQIKVKNIVIKT